MDRMRRNNYPRKPWFASLSIIAGALGFGCALTVLVAGIMWSTRPAPGPIRVATAILEVTPASKMVTPVVTSTPAITATADIGQPPSSSAEITIGAFVQIGGTGGTGLRFRSEPNLEGEVLLVGVDSEVFRVDAGPVSTDDHTWWYLVGP
ncbi:hypothetical protein ACFLZW_07580, partial [Chloroflexota bacterium]